MNKFIIFLSLLTLSVTGYAKNLIVTVLPADSYQMQQTQKFFDEVMIKQVKPGDSLIVVEPITANIVYEFSRSDIVKYKAKKGVFDKISKMYDAKVIRGAFEKRRLELEATSVIPKSYDVDSPEANPASVFKLAADLQKVFYRHKTIKLIFLGDSYNFRFDNKELKQTYPSYNFITNNNSPFNIKEVTTLKPTVEVSLFYIKEPYYPSRVQEFYELVVKKIFKNELVSFNSQFTFNKKKTPDIASFKTIFPNKMVLVDDKIEESCSEEDDFDVIENTFVYSIKGILNNICRKNLSVDFQLVNNSGEINRAIPADINGTATVHFDLTPGMNELLLKNNKGIYRKVWSKDIKGGQDNLRLVDMSDVDGMVKLVGNNKFRKNGDEVEILKNGLQSIAKVQDGKFEKIFDLKKGDNTFSIKQLDGTYKDIVKNFTTECDDKITVDENKLNTNGDFFGSIENACRKDGSIITITYEEKEFHATVYNGSASFEIPLHNKVNDLYYKDLEGNIKGLQYEIRDFDSLVKVSIYWNAPSLLDLHIFEPGFNIQYPVDAEKYSSSTDRIPQKGHLQFINQTNGIGTLTINNVPSEQDIKKFTYSSYGYTYTAKYPQNIIGDIHIYVDNVNRHLIYGGETHCQNRSRGGVEFSYTVLINGSLDTGEIFINPATCIQNMNKGTGTMGWFADSSSQLFKKVIIKPL